MPLYQLTVSTTVVVQAEDEFDAMSIAEYCARDAIGDYTPDVDFDKEVKSTSDLCDGWDGDCVPYGNGGRNKSISEILEGK